MTARGQLLVAGTTSDAGKSTVVTGLCRALARRGVRVAPFKAQNMSNNSMVTADGAEIGRAQWAQARAARAEPEAAMNPVLLKPGSDLRSHAVVMGRPAGTLGAGDFATGRAHLARAAFAAFDDLTGRYDVVVCEGAGSPAEVNLRAGDYVNMGLARHGDIPTVVVGDIDRGGVLAALYGTVGLLEPADRALVAGFIINKFRGDVDLLRPGLTELEGRTGLPVLGVLPWSHEVPLDAEDSLSRPDPSDAESPPDAAGSLQVAALALPRISNFTDLDALALEPGVQLRYARSPRDVTGADLVVLPGTRATLADLAWLRSRGLDRAVRDHVDRGGAVLGVCGGAQLLGSAVEDPDGVEAAAGAAEAGLGLVPARTVFTPTKVLGLPTGTYRGVPAGGYEIHHGRLEVAGGDAFPGGVRAGRVYATMWHGLLEGDDFRRAWLSQVAAEVEGASFRPGEVSFAAEREKRLDAWGDVVEQHLDLDRVLELSGVTLR